jgi:hypothetical protein
MQQAKVKKLSDVFGSRGRSDFNEEVAEKRRETQRKEGNRIIEYRII